MGVNVSALITGLGIAGIAVGFAAKDSLENFIAGIAILLDDPFVVGDWVLVAGTYGQVSEITLRSTRLRTQGGEIVVFPNIQMTNQPIVNQSRHGPVRVNVPFSIAYKESIDSAREVALSASNADARVSGHHAPDVVTTKLGDSSVELELRVWVDDPADSVPLRFSLTEGVRKALAKADIEIPFPHLQLFIDGAKGLTDLGPYATTGGSSTISSQ